MSMLVQAPVVSKSQTVKRVSQTAYTLTKNDNGSIIVFTAGTASTALLPKGLGIGFNVEIVQAGAGAVSLLPQDATMIAAGNFTATTSAGHSLRVRSLGAIDQYYITGGAAVPAALSSFWMFAATRTSHNNHTYIASSASTQFRRSRLSFGSPPWAATKIRLGFHNWYCANANSVTEFTVPNAKTISKCVVEYPAGVYTNITFNSGAATVSIATGATVFSDAIAIPGGIPANSQYWVWSADDLNLNDTGIGGYLLQVQNGDGLAYGSTTFSATLTSTALVGYGAGAGTASAQTSLSFAYGPSIVLMDGWDGRPVVEVLGDSDAEGGSSGQVRESAADIRGNRSYVQIGLDSTINGARRIPYNMDAIPGSSPHDTMNFTLTGGQFGRRYAALQQAQTLNGGMWPFTHIFSEHIANEVNSAVDYPSLKAAMDAYIANLKANFPGVPIVQTTPTPRTRMASGITTNWTNFADQTFLTTLDGPGPHAARQQIADYVASAPWSGVNPVDLRATMFAGPNADSWPLRTFTATLTAAANVGDTTLTMSAAPAIGELLVLEPGSATNAEMIVGVTAVSGTGPYVVTVAPVGTTKAHAVGALVKASPTPDGARVGYAMCAGVMGPALAAIKDAAFAAV